jgi:hypothetical protein
MKATSVSPIFVDFLLVLLHFLRLSVNMVAGLAVHLVLRSKVEFHLAFSHGPFHGTSASSTYCSCLCINRSWDSMSSGSTSLAGRLILLVLLTYLAAITRW